MGLAEAGTWLQHAIVEPLDGELEVGDTRPQGDAADPIGRDLRLATVPLRRHPVARVQEQILRAATGPQLVQARTLAERDACDERLNAEARAEAATWCDLLNCEIGRRVGDDAPEAIFML